MSDSTILILQLVIFALLCGVTFLLIWSFAGFVAEKPDTLEPDMREAVEQAGKLMATECRDPKPDRSRTDDVDVAA